MQREPNLSIWSDRYRYSAMFAGSLGSDDDATLLLATEKEEEKWKKDARGMRWEGKRENHWLVVAVRTSSIYAAICSIWDGLHSSSCVDVQ